METDDLIRTVAGYMLEAREVLFVTGAGISVDSGLPTYRGIGGLYDDGLTEEGLAIEEALSGDMMEDRPEICWRYIQQIEQACRGARPNGAHRVIAAAELEFHRASVLTQNVDGLHVAAGSRNVTALHGDIHRLLCVRCDHRATVIDYADLQIPPSCPDCGALIRPDVVLFGEMLGSNTVARLNAEPSPTCDLVFTIGTSSLFPYISGIVLAARARGIRTVEINPDESEVSQAVDIRLRLGAEKALTAIWDVFLERRGG
jgi:NAD-dependent deacetylase